MPLKDVLVAALSRPAARVVDAPVREIIEEVLRDHGYASPADLARIKDDLAALGGKLAPLERKVGDLEGQIGGLREEAAGLRAALSKVEAELADSRAELAAARQALAEAQTRAAAAPVAAPASACKVPGCERRVASNGFCRAHLMSWRAGRLGGYVSPEGLVALGQGAGRVGLALAGEPYAVDGARVRVAGREAAVVAL